MNTLDKNAGFATATTCIFIQTTQWHNPKFGMIFRYSIEKYWDPPNITMMYKCTFIELQWKDGKENTLQAVLGEKEPYISDALKLHLSKRRECFEIISWLEWKKIISWKISVGSYLFFDVWKVNKKILFK